MRLARRTTLFSGLLLLTFGGVETPGQSFGTDLSGVSVRSLSAGDSRAVVLIFAASDCPVSNRYFPEIERLSREFVPRHVAFWVVYPNADETGDMIRAHGNAFGHGVAELLDPRQSLVRLAGVRTTPEAAVFAVGGAGGQGKLRLMYRGRIDDRTANLGHERPAATRHELEEAIEAVLTGRPVRPAGGRPAGCAIVRAR